MTYFNPNIYNYDNLKKEDKLLIDFYNYAIDDMKNYFESEIYLGENATTLEKIKYEVAEEIKENLLEWMDSCITEQYVGIIDNYDNKE